MKKSRKRTARLTLTAQGPSLVLSGYSASEVFKLFARIGIVGTGLYLAGRYLIDQSKALPPIN